MKKKSVIILIIVVVIVAIAVGVMVYLSKGKKEPIPDQSTTSSPVTEEVIDENAVHTFESND